MEVGGMSASHLLDMLPTEVEARLQAGEDIAIVPIGSLEQHGPHLLLWTDGYWAQALAQEIGRVSGGAVLPAVPFSWVGCTNAFPGGVGVRESVFIAYLRAVVRGLWKSGFRRIVIVNGHGGNFYAMRSFPHDVFKEDGIPVFCIYGEAGCTEAHEAIEQAGGGEGTWLVGALRLLGREDLVQVVQENARLAVAEFGDRPQVRFEPQSGREARRLGVVGHDYSHECLHVQPDSRLDPDAGAAALGQVAEHVAKVLDDLRGYVDEVSGSPQGSSTTMP
jgi:creatinine amidohydrolase/Fe(II)-dependent formamide hydrolase-like protein